ncbi:MAG: phosphoenolpyruvate synthase [Deltaproteobacteria bacterium]|nr:MAG: phosphoenolpyruvate synthase [Deltaproteobacteria bacterium]
MPSLVLPFAEIALSDLPVVGGKGANLGELAAAGFPVPPGYCVTTEAFRQFLAGAPDDVLAALDGVPAELDAVRAAGATVRERLSSVPIPEAVVATATEAWQALGAEHPYAVRSSATAEDLPDASFAGQQDTYLNLRGEAAILDGIRRCWISLFTDRAILYRIQHGFAHEEVLLAVVVQRQILPEVSGILFTADPITSSRGIVSIDAGFGLGEGLVSGKVSADLYQVGKHDGKLVDKRIATKELAIRPLPEGGTEEVALSEAEREAPVLTDAQAESLAALGLRIEAHYGQPQDVEWCVEGDEVFVVQSRPITTLHPLPEPPPSPESVARGLHVYISWNHVQSMTDAMPDLARSLIHLANPLGKAGRPVLHTKYMASAAGRVYHDATELFRLPLVGTRMAAMVEQSDPLMGRALGDVVRREAFSRGGRLSATLAMLWALFLRGLPVGIHTTRHLWFGAPEPKVPAIADRLEATLTRWRDRVDAAKPGVERLSTVRDMVLAILPDIDHTLAPIFASVAANVTLRWFTGQPTVVDTMLRATPHNVLTEKDEALAAVAELARGDEALVALIREAPEGDVTQFLARVAHPTFRDGFAAWMDRFGARGPGEVDVSRLRYRDDCRPILRALGAMLDGPPNAFAEQQAAYREQALEAGDILVSAASRGVLGPLRGRFVRRFTRVGRQLFAAREQPKFYWLRVVGLAREVFLAEGARFAEQGLFTKPDDVWFFDIDELVALAGGDHAVAEKLDARKARFKRDQETEPARVLTSEGEAVVAKHSDADAPEGALLGVSASAGVSEGVVRVIHDPAAETLQPGEILVAAYTDPGWTPLFPQAGALVMEVGGQMTHGSVVAREYGIPAVVCVPGATKRLQTGQRVRVDGDHGWVLPLED